MDSRIREIEQWVAEAKNDLGECGREAYINKLYLLDAEIRAIIKEDRSLPAAGSPRQRQGHVRRFTLPALSAVGAVGVLLLAASAAYLLSELNGQSSLQLAEPQAPSLTIASEQPAVIQAGYVPQSIPGEEILPAGWTTPAESDATASPAPLPARRLPSVEPSSSPAVPADPTPAAPATRVPAGTANEAVAVVAAAPVLITPAVAGGGLNSGTSGTSLSNGDGGIERIVAASSLFSEFPEYVPEAGAAESAEPNNQTFDALMELHETTGSADPAEITLTGDESVDNGDNSESNTEAEATDDEPLLDESALAEKLKDKLDQRDKS